MAKMVKKQYINSRHNSRRTFLDFKEAKKIVRKLGIKTQRQYRKAYKEGKIPKMPHSPHSASQYRKDWKGYGDFFGTGRLCNNDLKKKIKSFKVCRTYIRKLNIQTWREWAEYRKSSKKPRWIPGNPDVHFKKDWISWADWFGNGKTKFWNFNKSKEWIQNSGLQIKNKPHFTRLRKQGIIPMEIPAAPQNVYSYHKKVSKN